MAWWRGGVVCVGCWQPPVNLSDCEVPLRSLVFLVMNIRKHVRSWTALGLTVLRQYLLNTCSVHADKAVTRRDRARQVNVGSNPD